VLSSAVDHISKGDLSYRIDIDFNGELGALAQCFNEMTGNLQDNLVHLKSLSTYQKALLSTMTEMICIISSQGIVIKEVKTAGSILSSSMEGAHLSKYLPAESYNILMRSIKNSLATGVASECRFYSIDENLTTGYFVARITCFQGDALVVTRNVTAEVEALNKSGQQERLLAAIFEAAPPMYYKNQDGKYLGCNQAFEQLAGQPRDFIVGKTTQELVKDPAIYAVHIEADQQAMLYPSQVVVYQAKTPFNYTENRKTVLISKAAYMDEFGRPAGVVGVVTDITEIEIARMLLQQAVNTSNNVLQLVCGYER
jgi:PAS domain S-box-containing protein